MFKLKSDNGRVSALFRAGKDMVRTNISVSAAQHLIDVGQISESDYPGYPICVDNTWYFEGVEIKKAKKAKKGED